MTTSSASSLGVGVLDLPGLFSWRFSTSHSQSLHLFFPLRRCPPPIAHKAVQPSRLQLLQSISFQTLPSRASASSGRPMSPNRACPCNTRVFLSPSVSLIIKPRTLAAVALTRALATSLNVRSYTPLIIIQDLLGNQLKLPRVLLGTTCIVSYHIKRLP